MPRPELASGWQPPTSGLALVEPVRGTGAPRPGTTPSRRAVTRPVDAAQVARIRSTARAPLGVLVAAGEEGIGASVTAALLAHRARADGARVLLVGPSLRAQRLATLFGVALAAHDVAPTFVSRGIQVSSRMPSVSDADVLISVPVSQAQPLLDAVDDLSAHASPTRAAVLCGHGPGSLAACFAVLKLIVTRRPQCAATVAPFGDADLTALHEAAERWLGRPLATSPALPLDPTLPVALRHGIPLDEAVADTALTHAAGALWAALSTSASTGALS